MQKRNSKRPKKGASNDPNVLTNQVVRRFTESQDTPEIDRSLISKVMSQMGRKGGRIGGKRRLETMSPQQRSEVALKAARARWSKRKGRS